MIVLGIDPGVERTGFGVISREGAKTKLLDFGCITTGRKLSFSTRLAEIAADLTEIILKWRPDITCVEEVFFSKNVKTAMKVSQARGVVLEILEEFGIPIREIKPQQVKMAVTGSGSADKTQMKKMTRLLLGMEENFKYDDAADALACCLAYHSSYAS